MMTTAAPMKKKVSYYYDAEIGNFYYAQGHPMKPHRVRMTHELVVAYEMFNKMEVLSPPRAPERELTRFHADEYVNFLKTVTPETAQENAMTLQRFNVVEDCPVFDGLWDFCQIAGGGSLAGASRLNSGSADIAINWAGGLHHAKKAEASGFCYVNDCVLGILELLKVHARVLYVDIDIHHGDGVEEAFYTTDRVMTVSFHKFGDYFPGTGDVGDFGNGPGLHYSVNFPLKDGINDESYREVFEPIMTKVMEWYSPGAVVLQCGADSLSGDRLGSFNLSLRGHAQCVDFFRRYDVPLLLLGGGGYTIRNVARCWAFETSRAINMELSDDMPYNKYFEFYGPEFRLHLTPSNMENVNSREYLETVKAKVMESLRHLPSAPSVQMHDAPPPVDVTDPSLSKDMQVHAKPRSQDPYFDSDAEDDDDEDYSHALKNAKKRTKMTRASEPPETTAPSGASATVAMNGGHARAAPQAQSREAPTPMEIDEKAAPRTEVDASASKPAVGAPTPPQQAPAPEEPRQASTVAASERGKLTDEVPMEVDEAPASTVRTRTPSIPADEGAAPADAEAVDQKPPKKARHAMDATGRDEPQVSATPAKPEASDGGAGGGDGGRGSVGAAEPAKEGGQKPAAEAAAVPDDAPADATAPAPKPAATAEVSSTVDSARAAASASGSPAAPEVPDVTTEGPAPPEDGPSERAESATVAPSSGTGEPDGRPEDTRRDDKPRTDATPQEGTTSQPEPPKDGTEAREPSEVPAAGERPVPAAERPRDEAHQGPSTADKAGKDDPEAPAEGASAGAEDKPPGKAEAASAEDEPAGRESSAAADDEQTGTAASAPAEDEPAGKVAPTPAGNEPARESPPAKEPDTPSAPAKDGVSGAPEAEQAEAPAKDGATAADEPEAPPPSAAPAEAAKGAATAEGASATERREPAQEQAGAVGASEGDSQAAERRGAAEPPPPAGGGADAAKTADSGADAGAAPERSAESTVPGEGEPRDPADKPAASAEPAADGRPDDKEEGTAGGGERPARDEDGVQSSDGGRTAGAGGAHFEAGDREAGEIKPQEVDTKPPEAPTEPAAAPTTTTTTASEAPADGDKADGGSDKASGEAQAKDAAGHPEAADGADARPEPAGEADKAGHEPMDVEPAATAAPARDGADENSKAADPKPAEDAANEG